MDNRYGALKSKLSRSIPGHRLIDDELRTLAFGADASFYRLIPQLVVKVENESEITTLLKEASSSRTPVTFRAAGTSLSGQALSDSVLALLGNTWKRHRIHNEGTTISLQPGIVGAHANILLARFGRKIGPDPASINAAMIGGIVANNASGMCCGTQQNSYNTLESMRVIISDGTLLDTADDASKNMFRQRHPEILNRLSMLAERVKKDQPLADRIRQKYRLKNTTGYSLNALVDFDDPFDILQHLMVGSEGTLGFIAEVTLRTVPELPHKATSLMHFTNVHTACNAVTVLRDSAPVDAVELMDRASLHSIERKNGMPEYIRDLDEQVASLLVETRAVSPPKLDEQISLIGEHLSSFSLVRPLAFTADPAQFGKLWSIRKGLFPTVGAMRKTGTTVIIEDVAFPLPALADATIDLQRLFKVHGYDDAIIFGHARDGNLHFVFKQDFNESTEIRRYANFMNDLTSMVVRGYDGSLKAEHGTGRNMSPFVELEWGSEAYALMKEIKGIFDPENILNPGVVINSDPRAHLRNLKPLPAADPSIDKCIECGFCEVWCPSKDLTLTPRQRIVAYREISRLEATRGSRDRISALRRQFNYLGDKTCATDGLCSVACPVEINTGELIKTLRHGSHGPLANAAAWFVAHHIGNATAAMRMVLATLGAFHEILGSRLMEMIGRGLRTISGNRIPLWNREMPKATRRIPMAHNGNREKETVVYFPTCINRTFGKAPDSTGLSLVNLIPQLLEKAGYNVVIPEQVDNLCCGMAFASKGFTEQASMKSKEVEDVFLSASDSGRFPILVDASPCLLRLRETFQSELNIMDQAEFASAFLLNRLSPTRLPITVSIHATCSTTKMGMAKSLEDVVGQLVEKVVVPNGSSCCGWAGDRGFTVPELNDSALMGLRQEILEGCEAGYSTSRMCEIGLSLHAGIPYESVFHLIDRSVKAGSSSA